MIWSEVRIAPQHGMESSSWFLTAHHVAVLHQVLPAPANKRMSSESVGQFSKTHQVRQNIIRISKLRHNNVIKEQYYTERDNQIAK